MIYRDHMELFREKVKETFFIMRGKKRQETIYIFVHKLENNQCNQEPFWNVSILREQEPKMFLEKCSLQERKMHNLLLVELYVIFILHKAQQCNNRLLFIVDPSNLHKSLQLFQARQIFPFISLLITLLPLSLLQRKMHGFILCILVIAF